MLADFCTPEIANFTLRFGKGMALGMARFGRGMALGMARVGKEWL